MLVDTHCHLTDKGFEGKVGEVVERARRAGVEKIIVLGSSLIDSKKAIEIVEENKGVYAMVGFYPGALEKMGDLNKAMEKLRRLARSSKAVVGIGEIGLDCYWNKQNIDEQKKLFKLQLELANELNLPVAIHNRLAEKEIREVFDLMNKLPRGVFHAWSGDGKFLEYVLERGFYVSFAGNVTYKGAENLRTVLKRVPLDRLFLETDSPYLSPEPLRGKLNEPVNVKITAKFVASLLNISFEDLVRQTSKNALCLFTCAV